MESQENLETKIKKFDPELLIPLWGIIAFTRNLEQGKYSSFTTKGEPYFLEFYKLYQALIFGGLCGYLVHILDK